MLIVFLKLGRVHLAKLSLRHNLYQLIVVLAIFLGFYFCSKALPYTPSNYGTWVLYASVVFCMVTIASILVFLAIDRDNMQRLKQRILRNAK